MKMSVGMFRAGMALLASISSASTTLASGKSVAECQVFANQAFVQLQEGVANHCNFPQGWNGSWQQNFDYCRSAQPESTDKIAHRRQVMLHMCKDVCSGYAAAAVNDIRIATEGGCLHPGLPDQMQGVTGPLARWSGDFNSHFNWCMSGVSEQVIGREREVRATEAPRCQICNDYSFATEQFALKQKQKKCDYDLFHNGDQWNTDRGLHFKHCMGHPLSTVSAWTVAQTNERHNLLQKCPTLQSQAICRRFATLAVNQRKAIDNKTTTGFCGLQGLENSRWNPDYNVHYQGCLLNPLTAVPEQQARDARLKACGIADKPSPPMTPLPPEQQCNFGVVMTLDACTNGYDGTPITYGDPKTQWPACGLGETEEQARLNAIAAYHAIQITVSDSPGWGECSYSSTTIRGCSCDSGLAVRSYPGRWSPSPADTVREPEPTRRFIPSAADRAQEL